MPLTQLSAEYNGIVRLELTIQTPGIIPPTLAHRLSREQLMPTTRLDQILLNAQPTLRDVTMGWALGLPLAR